MSSVNKKSFRFCYFRVCFFVFISKKGKHWSGRYRFTENRRFSWGQTGGCSNMNFFSSLQKDFFSSLPKDFAREKKHPWSKGCNRRKKSPLRKISSNKYIELYGKRLDRSRRYGIVGSPIGNGRAQSNLSPPHRRLLLRSQSRLFHFSTAIKWKNTNVMSEPHTKTEVWLGDWPRRRKCCNREFPSHPRLRTWTVRRRPASSAVDPRTSSCRKSSTLAGFGNRRRWWGNWCRGTVRVPGPRNTPKYPPPEFERVYETPLRPKRNKKSFMHKKQKDSKKKSVQTHRCCLWSYPSPGRKENRPVSFQAVSANRRPLDACSWGMSLHISRKHVSDWSEQFHEDYKRERESWFDLFLLSAGHCPLPGDSCAAPPASAFLLSCWSGKCARLGRPLFQKDIEHRAPECFPARNTEICRYQSINQSIGGKNNQLINQSINQRTSSARFSAAQQLQYPV